MRNELQKLVFTFLLFLIANKPLTALNLITVVMGAVDGSVTMVGSWNARAVPAPETVLIATCSRLTHALKK